jgi:PmbA protein
MNNEKLLKTKNLINKEMEKLNVDNYTCIMNISKNITITNINNQYESFNEKEEETIKFQIFANKKQYIFSKTGLDNLEEIIRNIPIIMENLEDSEFYDREGNFHEKAFFETNLYKMDYNIPNNFIDSVVNLLNKNINMKYNGEIFLSYLENEEFIFNKKNYEHLRKTSYSDYYISLTEEENNDKYTDYEYETIINPLNPEEILNNIIEKLNKMKIKTQIPVNKYKIIFTQKNSSSLIKMIIKGLYGDLMWRQKSFLLNKIGMKVFGENINIIEKPQVKDSLSNSNVDMEGIHIDEKYLVEKGVVKTMLLNREYADKFKLTSTGNGWDFSIGYTNIYLEPGSMSYEELIKEMNTGIIIHDIIGSGFQVNNGEISVSILGFYYENNIFKGSVTGTLNGNIIDVLSNSLISNDLDLNKSICPSILLKNMTFCPLNEE